MGVVYARDLDWTSSQRHFEQGIALNPSLSQVYTSYSFFTLRPLHKFEEAERFLNGAQQSDPLSLDVWRELPKSFSLSVDTMRRSIYCSACEPWIRSFWTPAWSLPAPWHAAAVWRKPWRCTTRYRQQHHRITVRTHISKRAGERTPKDWRSRMRISVSRGDHLCSTRRSRSRIRSAGPHG